MRDKPKPAAKVVGEWIVKQRKSRKLSQAQLAEALRVCRDQISRMERGQRGLDVQEFIWLARYMNVNLERAVVELALSVGDVPCIAGGSLSEAQFPVNLKKIDVYFQRSPKERAARSVELLMSLIREEETTVKAVMQRFNCPRQRAHDYLEQLRRAGLVDRNRAEGCTSYSYFLASGVTPGEVVEWKRKVTVETEESVV